MIKIAILRISYNKIIYIYIYKCKWMNAIEWMSEYY